MFCLQDRGKKTRYTEKSERMRNKWQPTPACLPGESQGPGSLGGCRLWGRTESDTPEAAQQQQQSAIKIVVTFKGQYPERDNKSKQNQKIRKPQKIKRLNEF